MKENLHFCVELAGTYWHKQPQYTILVNDTEIKRDTIVTASEESFRVEFDMEVDAGPCALKIRLENKDWTDTIQNEDKTAIVKDMLLNIRGVEIDEIDLGNLIYTKTRFVGDDPERPVLDRCQDLGWNGAWILEFESPFYIWLLENI
jgi:hypothetical protein